jgi:hypothetical protein
MKKLRTALLVTLFICIGVWLGTVTVFSQTPSTPGILGWYPAGAVFVRVQVDKNGVVQTNSSSGSGCPNPCPVVGSVATGKSAPNPVTTGFRDDSGNVQAVYGFTDNAAVVISSGTDTKMVAGSAGKLIYVGSLSFALTASETVTIQEGTTVSTPCDTSTLVLYGPVPGVVSLALDPPSPLGALQTQVTGDDLCLHLGGSATAGGGIRYGQH